ncbi:MAG: single-stranded-DNA-specific exonuclease RecJ [Gloeobacterales cyanobacterium]
MLPLQRWSIAEPHPKQAWELATSLDLSPVMGQILLNRGITTPEAAKIFFDPTCGAPPEPKEHFPDLASVTNRLVTAIEKREKIAICGDYDCDGMTSTALLIRAIRYLGGVVDYAIPSRMQEGYGINVRIVEEFYQENVDLVITVDNGISALAPLQRAEALGLSVIITDHHELPEVLPPAVGILNPKLIPLPDSPYHTVAGVGVAYILALEVARRFDKLAELQDPLLELFTLGTIADLALLTGVNRQWVQRGLVMLPFSTNPGIQALMAVAGYSDHTQIKPEVIGFGLGPRINAVGRIGDPQVVIELLTTDDPATALERANRCEAYNQERKELCNRIEKEAVSWVENHPTLDLREERVLVIVQPEWHHGVIGIVASRLVERYGAPVFIGSIEGNKVRGSARGIPEFNIFEGLEYCKEFFTSFGGHPMAGGFSMPLEHLEAFSKKMSEFAHSCLEAVLICPLVKIDGYVALEEVDENLFEQVNKMHPCGIGNPDPTFWCANLLVVQQRTMGKEDAHLRLVVDDGKVERQVVAWRMGHLYPVPKNVDLAFKLRENTFRDVRSIQLELSGIREATVPLVGPLCRVECKAPRTDYQPKTWIDQRGTSSKAVIESLLSTADTKARYLLYGYQRPEFGTEIPLDYDRPHRPQGANYEGLLLWTLPPSPLHLAWLLHAARPLAVHIFARPVPSPSTEELTILLRSVIHQSEPLNLLALAQQYWTSPRIVVNVLMALGVSLEGPLPPDLGHRQDELADWYSGSSLLERVAYVR